MWQRLCPLTVVLLGLLGMEPYADTQPRELQFCYENEDSYPWVLRNGDGLNIRLISLLSRELGLKIKLLPMPWKRCLSELAGNRMDGAFAASFVAERLAYGQYPMHGDGSPDQNRRLHLSSYSLYRLKGDNLSWSGEEFINLRGPIGTLPGFSIMNLLKKKGATIDDGSRSPGGTLRKLLLKRIQGAALQTQRADFELASNPVWAKYIERIPLPLERKAYYLMLSHDLVQQDPALADTIWSDIARLRQSEEYGSHMEAFFR
ncbi:substrate-binding periplasmic protein [Aeromonas dhakensis]|uniref:substrate-binding periplasmic protein n=1 Tax=Aeromonas dhakensis TaxID=196024 RepID=UPI001FCBBFA0|nr:transporter substrate-binding domain-containing protein [Aeromonas dhakensis]MCJ2367884.1 transporter substrate-binding domain-containing protein [Aeromonas dhakensis]